MNTKSAAEGEKVIVLNKNARREYEVLSTLEAGISLLGCEVKSIREGAIQLKESYVRFKGREIYLVGCHISPYAYSINSDYVPTRDRKLLLHLREIIRLSNEVRHKGLTLIPLRVYFKNGRCKLEIGVGRGKKLFDKRQDIKDKQGKRAAKRAVVRGSKGA